METEEIENQTIHYKSSEEIELDNDSIDTIITSPPYNRRKVYSDDDGNVYNDQKSDKEYYLFLKKVWRECFRVLKPSGIFFLNIGDSANDQGKSEIVVNTAVEVGFIRLQTIVWVKSILGKGHYTPTGGDRRLNNLYENIFVLVKNKKEYKLYPKNIGVPYSDKSNIGRYGDQDLRDAGNLWFIPYSKTTGKTIKKGHDAPFPVELAIKCIKLTKAQSILDPFVGTGSTLAAAKVCGIKGVGYEKYPRKDVIKERVMSSNVDLIENLNILQITELEQAISYLSTLLERFSDMVPVKDVLKDTKKEKYLVDNLKKVLFANKFNNKLLNELSVEDKSKINSDLKKYI